MFLVPYSISKQGGGGGRGVFWVKTDYIMSPFDQETLICKQLSHWTDTFRAHGKIKCSVIIRLYCSLKHSSSCPQSKPERSWILAFSNDSEGGNGAMYSWVFNHTSIWVVFHLTFLTCLYPCTRPFILQRLDKRPEVHSPKEKWKRMEFHFFKGNFFPA